MTIGNLFASLPTDLSEEVIETLAQSEHAHIERIVSKGHHSPASGWYDQNRNEWVIVLKGEAVLAFPDRDDVTLKAGDFLNIPAHQLHRVKWTTPTTETVWLAIHYA